MLGVQNEAGSKTGSAALRGANSPVADNTSPFTTGLLKALASSGLKGELDLVIGALPLRMYAKRCDMTYVACSARFAADFGLEPQHMIGRTNSQLFGENYTAPCQAEEAKVLATGLTRVTEQSYGFRDSTIWIRATRAPVLDVDGEIAGLVCILEDVSAERATRRQREDAVAGLAQLWVYSREGVLVVDAAGATIIDMNPAAQVLTGFTRDDLLSQPLTDIFTAADRPRAQRGFRDALANRSTLGGLQLHRKDAGSVPCEMSVSEVFDTDARAHVLVFIRPGN
jgi:PAS domain S-box-containing protein